MDSVYHAEQQPLFVSSKVCRTCHQEKPIELFQSMPRMKDGHSNQCNPCRSAERRQKYQSRRPSLPPAVNGGKVCSKCLIEKPLEDYYTHKDGKDGHMTFCKECTKADVSRHHQETYQHKRPRLPQPVNGGKVCRKCHVEKPLSEFGKASDRANGYASHCKECTYKRTAEKRRARGARLRMPKAAPGCKMCVKCRVEKPLEAFQRQKRGKIGYSSRCKDCLNGQTRRYYDETYREQKRTQNSAWRETHQEEHRAMNYAWRDAHPYAIAERQRRRTARIRETMVEPVDYRAILKRDGAWCYICGQAIDLTIKKGPARLTFDHEKPLAGKGERKGTHTADNIHPAHHCCNSRKGTKLLSEMTPHQRRGPKH